jgi:hypothetical protein
VAAVRQSGSVAPAGPDCGRSFGHGRSARRGRCLASEGTCRGSAGHRTGQQHTFPGHGPARVGRAYRARAPGLPGQDAGRRNPADATDAAAIALPGRGIAGQADFRDGHRGAAASPGWSPQSAGERPGRGCARVGGARRAWRVAGPAPAAQGAQGSGPVQPRLPSEGSAPLPGVDARAARNRAGHRPDRLGQVDDALRCAGGDQRQRAQDPHGGGPGRIPGQGRDPDPGQFRNRVHVRTGVARDPAPGPGRDHDRRDPRPGNRRDRRAIVPDRAPGPLDAAYQRCGERLHPPDRHGRGTLPGGDQRARGAGPASGAPAVPALQRPRARPAGGRGGGRGPRRSGAGTAQMASGRRLARAPATAAAWASTNWWTSPNGCRN